MNLNQILSFAAFLVTMGKLSSHDKWPRERILSFQRSEFEKLRNHALKHSAFYQKLYKGLEKAPLTSLPIVTKSALMTNFDDAVTDKAITRAGIEAFLPTMTVSSLYLGKYHIIATSGTTGERGYFPFDRARWRVAYASGGRSVTWATGRRPSSPERSAMMSTSVPWHMTARVSAELRRLGLFKDQQTFDSAETVQSIVEKLNAYQPQTMTVYPTMMRVLAHEQLAGRLKISPTKIQCSSEVLTQDTSDLIKQVFNVTPSNLYASSECGSLGGTCLKNNRMHLCEDLNILEIVDKNGNPVPAGTQGSKALLTVLSSRTLPLIRYELNDSLTLDPEPCDCGLPYACLKTVNGRTGEVLHFSTRSGEKVEISPMQLSAALRALPVSGAQYAVTPDALQVDFVSSEAASIEDKVRDAIVARLSQSNVSAVRVNARKVTRLVQGITGKTVAIKSPNT